MTDPRDGRDYVFYASVPWDGPWMVEQNLAHALAARHRVLYVDPPLSPLTPLRGGGAGRDIRVLTKRSLRSVDRLRVFTPLALPPLTHRVARAASAPLLRAQVRHAAARAGLRRPVVVAVRSLVELAGALDEALRVLLVIDHARSGAALFGVDAQALVAEQKAMCELAGLICATSHELQRSLAEDAWHSELLLHGFHADLAPAYEAATRAPGEYEWLPRPLLGYTGRIDEKLDLDLIVRLARRFSSGSLLLIGALSPRLSDDHRRLLASQPNIHLLGAKPREQLPAYVRHLDCALLPYADSEFVRHGSPLKLWDYLYAGPPIVGTGCPALRRYPPPLVAYAERAEDAGELVAAALSDPHGAGQRRAFALDNSWDSRATQLDELVDRALAAV